MTGRQGPLFEHHGSLARRRDIRPTVFRQDFRRSSAAGAVSLACRWMSRLIERPLCASMASSQSSLPSEQAASDLREIAQVEPAVAVLVEYRTQQPTESALLLRMGPLLP
ncbi:MAG: hypothetical protein GAK38_00203 [Xylophilus sp.]|nr:MAG: hypothetical protein GAK38_00203 [Xylophilus sp.]